MKRGPFKIRNAGTVTVPASLVIIGGMSLLVLLVCVSVTKGAADIPRSVVWDAFFHFDSSNSHHLMVIDLRLPRVIAAAFIGAALSTAGAIMQGTMHNPMADSGLLGINAGAGFAVALCFAFMPAISYGALVVFAFIGAAFGTFLVMGIAISKSSSASPMRLILAGAAVTALLGALSQGIALVFNIGLDVLFWTVGGVTSITWPQFYILAPVVGLALTGALLLSPSISIINTGEDVAKGLGVNTTIVKILSAIVVLMLAGVSVSIVGSVAFVGLLSPHMARFLVGADYRKIIPSSAVLGAVLLVAADFGSRNINPPFEVPLGVITSLLGVPFFLYISRKMGRGL